MLVENPTRITEAKIKRMAKQAKGRITAIYLRWAVCSTTRSPTWWWNALL